MQFGTPTTFAIECFHDPISNASSRIFGRMSILANGKRLGDIDEPACMLNVTVVHLSDALSRIETLDETEFYNLGDVELFEVLNHALYGEDDRSDTEIVADAAKYSKFDFLTNGGESFDHTKSFLVAHGEQLRLVFKDRTGAISSARFSRMEFECAVKAFIGWVAHESAQINA
jgi:hypothetical protein